MFKLICVTNGGCYTLATDSDQEAVAKSRIELARPETVSVTRFSPDGKCVGVDVDWSNL